MGNVYESYQSVTTGSGVQWILVSVLGAIFFFAWTLYFYRLYRSIHQGHTVQMAVYLAVYLIVLVFLGMLVMGLSHVIMHRGDTSSTS
jgi:hypothetical protein